MSKLSTSGSYAGPCKTCGKTENELLTHCSDGWHYVPATNFLTYYCDDARHLVCTPYTVQNLHIMAQDLNIKRCWFHVGASYPHYDIPKRRIEEFKQKCAVIATREILEIVKEIST